MRISEMLNAMAAWLESPTNEALLLAEENEECMKVVAQSCVLAAALLKQAAEEVNVLEPTKTYRAWIFKGDEEKAYTNIVFKAHDNHDAGKKADKLLADMNLGPDYFILSIDMVEDSAASKITPESIEEIAALATALDSSNDPRLKKQASVLDELLLTIAAPPHVLADKKAADDKRIDELRKKYEEPRNELHTIDKTSDAVKAIDKSNMTKQYKLNEQHLSTRYCPQHFGTPVSRVGEHMWQCPLDKAVYNYDTGFTLDDGRKFPGGSVDLQTSNSISTPFHAIFDTRTDRLNTSR